MWFLLRVFSCNSPFLTVTTVARFAAPRHFARKICACRVVAYLAGFKSMAVNYDRPVSKTAITVMQFYSTDYLSAS